MQGTRNSSPTVVQEEAELRLRRQREMKQDFEDQMALKELILQAAKEEEETFKKAMLAKFAEDDRIELMNAQKQRMKQLEHKRAVEKLIEERRSQFLADKQRELEELQLQQRRQGCINEIIEEERLRLLKEHAAKLLGYLPKGVFKREDDVDMLGEEFRKAYQKRDGVWSRVFIARPGETWSAQMLPLDVSVTAVLQLVTVGPGLSACSKTSSYFIMYTVWQKLNTLVL